MRAARPSVQVQSVAWSRDGKFLASGGQDGSIHLWQPLLRSTVSFGGSHRRWRKMSCAQLHGWTTSFDKVGRPVQSKTERPEAELTSAGSITLLAWDPSNGDRLFSVSGDKELRYEASWQPPVNNLRTLLMMPSHCIRVWNIKLAQCMGSIRLNTCQQAQWHPTGQEILVRKPYSCFRPDAPLNPCTNVARGHRSGGISAF